jgi:quercetin dioxygenase-like cupin family protein
MHAYAVALLALSATTAATPTPSFPPLKRVPVLEKQLPDANPPVRMVRGATIDFAPGQPTGRHRHPASTVGVVTAGSFAFQIEGGPTRILHTGDSFFEPAGQTIVKFDNASRTARAAITVFYLTDSKTRPLIELLNQK